MERLLLAASTPLLTNITVANMSANYEVMMMQYIARLAMRLFGVLSNN